MLDSEAYSVTAEATALARYDIAVITVPTPLRDGAQKIKGRGSHDDAQSSSRRTVAGRSAMPGPACWPILSTPPA
ncbi:hypothetical protein ACH4VM_38225 [Streptomyces sp. NPDC020792]|uniref:hypothetical protein n=1 Tax=Streptomyces sp. NPDC020792 TaxID=3365089 RepID=UPI0037AD88F2